jgi:amino acid permease
MSEYETDGKIKKLEANISMLKRRTRLLLLSLTWILSFILLISFIYSVFPSVFPYINVFTEYLLPFILLALWIYWMCIDYIDWWREKHQTQLCKHCGKKIEVDATFCKHCGKPNS